jgi:hypothetical protein
MKDVFDVSGDRFAARIQRYWRNAIADPDFEVCRKRLRAEHDDLSFSAAA